ncbi:putative mitochondrial protein [Cardamine amara subsp. amara]|uniref:Mitochondrial protein n=1 Tax=Cardamine amara subsp. amara TaxID=228776 RepID=A0ABD1AZL3_CARAN
MINFQKSSIIFGKKVTQESKDAVKVSLGIDKEGGEGTYLGLPECFSGSKVQLLSFIREKLQGRMQGWFTKSLSPGGKETLMKSVAMSLPVYAMSCFRLPKDTCKRITSAMIESWWSNEKDKRKIPWVAWKTLCRQKDLGGLGFRDIGQFNQAL